MTPKDVKENIWSMNFKTKAVDDVVLSLARDFAVSAHGGQKYGDQPYVRHLDDVVRVLTRYDAPLDVRTAGYLHDVLEDTATKESALYVRFGRVVTDLVLAVTKIPNLSRREGFAKNLDKIRAGGPKAIQLKLGDRIANVTCCVVGNEALFDMYLKEHYQFRNALYMREHDQMWAELDRLFALP